MSVSHGDAESLRDTIDSITRSTASLTGDNAGLTAKLLQWKHARTDTSEVLLPCLVGIFIRGGFDSVFGIALFGTMRTISDSSSHELETLLSQRDAEKRTDKGSRPDLVALKEINDLVENRKIEPRESVYPVVEIARQSSAPDVHEMAGMVMAQAIIAIQLAHPDFDCSVPSELMP